MARRAPLVVVLTVNVALLTAAAVAAASVLHAYVLRNMMLVEAARELSSAAWHMAATVRDALDRPDALRALTRETFESTSIRVAAFHADGTVADGSAADAEPGARPGITDALSGRATTWTRKAADETRVNAAIPLVRDGRVVGALDLSRHAAWSETLARTLWLHSAIGGGVVAALAALILMRATRLLTRPIRDMTDMAARLRSGDLAQRVRLPAGVPRELAMLADALNGMAVETQARVDAVVGQSALIDAIFASMADGMIAIDVHGSIIDLNAAASLQLGVARHDAVGRSMSEVVRSREILEFIHEALVDPRPTEGTLTLFGEREQHLEVRANVLRNGGSGIIGLVIAFHDITHLRRLENLRRDFAANVSHELKTPITSIKGFVETLQEGALADPAAAQRFLAIIAKETDRLASIVEDLLSLARIEQGEERHEMVLHEAPIRQVLVAAAEACAEPARQRAVEIKLEVEGEPTASANAELLERAVVNLIDNAVKYSDQGAEVIVRAERDGRGLSISVRDTGCGIASEHLPRIFERFYRVDKARSRSQGGTGLGLAIVKHVAQVHGGSVAVESRIGIGSKFTIRLP